MLSALCAVQANTASAPIAELGPQLPEVLPVPGIGGIPTERGKWKNRGGGWVAPPILIQPECQFCGMVKAVEIAGSFQKEFQVHLGGRLLRHSLTSAHRFNSHPGRSRRGIPLLAGG